MKRFVVLLAACARGGMDGPTFQDAPPQQIDAPMQQIDAPMQPIDAPPSSCFTPGSPGMHLLLSEVCLSPSGSEFIEITNPTGATVDLSTYYLADNGNYWKLPAGAPVLTTNDFIVRFPAGAQIAANGVVTVATGSASAFMTAFGSMPTYSITDATITKVASNSTPTLTDAGEIVVLFQWDGTSPNVKDVDILLAGIPSAANSFIDKSNMMATTCAYAQVALSMTAQAASPASGKSTKRIALEGTSETHGGTGNGVTGDDETSENTGATWDTTYTAPTPGTVPTALMQ